MSRDDDQTDNELKTYLDGRDGVSATYRKTAREEPPKGLDRSILRAARADARPGTGRGRQSLARPYMLAASVMIAVLAGILYFRLPEDVLAPVESDASFTTSAEVQRAGNAAQPAAEQERQQAGAAPQAAANSQGEFRTRQLASASPTVGISPTASAPPPTRDSTALARSSGGTEFVISGALLERIEAEAQGNLAEPPAGAAAPREEIAVTGARIGADGQEDLSYRASRDEWLAVIRYLEEERNTLSAERDQAPEYFAAVVERMNEERRLYSAAYPDADLDAELAE
jgi:hypothetical protein